MIFSHKCIGCGKIITVESDSNFHECPFCGKENPPAQELNIVQSEQKKIDVCDICGRPLSRWNKDLISNKCGDCAKGNVISIGEPIKTVSLKNKMLLINAITYQFTEIDKLIIQTVSTSPFPVYKTLQPVSFSLFTNTPTHKKTYNCNFTTSSTLPCPRFFCYQIANHLVMNGVRTDPASLKEILELLSVLPQGLVGCAVQSVLSIAGAIIAGLLVSGGDVAGGPSGNPIPYLAGLFFGGAIGKFVTKEINKGKLAQTKTTQDHISKIISSDINALRNIVTDSEKLKNWLSDENISTSNADIPLVQIYNRITNEEHLN